MFSAKDCPLLSPTENKSRELYHHEGLLFREGHNPEVGDRLRFDFLFANGICFEQQPKKAASKRFFH